MNVDELSVEAYLADFAEQEHVLARMIRHPEPARGTVHTPREIAQQPLLWRHTARAVREQAGALKAFLQEAGCYGGDGPAPTVVFAGAGTSDYVGLSVVDLLRARLGAHVVHWPTTRITPCPEALLRPGERYLLLHVARSGNSPESAAVLDLGLERPAEEVRHLVITCNAEGQLARRAAEHPDKVRTLVMHEASNDRGLAMTSAFSCMVVAAQALGSLDDMDAFVERVDRQAAAAEHVLRAHTGALYDLAGAELERAFYLGNGDLLGAATESALKVQELTGGRLIAKGEDTMAFRHGPISAVNGRSLVVFFLSACRHARPYELDVLRQYQDAFAEIGAHVLVVADRAPRDLEEDEGLALRDNVTVVSCDPEGTWPARRLEQVNLATLVGQLVGVFAAYRRGVHVDDPSAENALYNRTVQGVRIYPYPSNGARATNGAR